MAKSGVYDYSTTPASNSDIDGTDSTGATGKVKDGDNYVRSMMSHLKGFANDLGGVNTVGGTANAMTVTLGQTASAITTGLRFQAVATTANTSTTPTLTITPATGSAFAAKTIKKYESSGVLTALQAGDNAPGLREYVYLSGPDAIVLLNPAQEARYAPGTLYGLTLSNDATDPTNDVGIAVGACRDSTDVANIDLLSALIKRLDASWVVGTNQGMLDGTESVAGTPDVSTWYHIWLIKRPDTGVIDVLASESATAPTMPTNYTLKRRIGAVYNDSAGNIKAFTQIDNWFLWNVPAADHSNTNPGTAAVLRALTVPRGVRVLALVSSQLFDASPTATTYCLLSSPDIGNSVPSASAKTQATTANTDISDITVQVWTNTVSEIRARLSASDADITLSLNTDGYYDLRGKS